MSLLVQYSRTLCIGAGTYNSPRSSSILLCMLLQFPNITDGTNGLFLRRLTLFLTPPRLPLFLGLVVVVALLLRAGSRSDGRLRGQV